MIQLIDEEDVVKKNRTRNVKNGGESTSTTTGTIQLIESDEVIDESKAPKIDKKKIIIKENAEKNKKYHLLRWKIKRFLIREDIIKRSVGGLF